MSVEECDVIIVGSGAAGSAAAWRLSFTDLDVVCIEQGGHVDPAKFPSTRIGWELEKEKEFNSDPNIRNSLWDYPINNAESPISLANFNAVGGSTILFSGHYPRFHPSDFRVKTLDGVADDWPISYEDVEPFYRMNEKAIGVAGLEGDPAYPKISGLLPPVPIGKMGQVIGEGFNKLGWHWWPSYSAIATVEFSGRSKCVNLGPCNTGCAQGAKSSADVSYWPQAIRNGVRLLVESRVSHIIQNRKDEVNGVSYIDSGGQAHELRAKIVVLAASGVGTPRLLLNSRSKYSPMGIGNSHDLVGRNLMLHPLGYVEGRFEIDLESMIGPQGCCISSQEFYETRPEHDFKRGYSMQILRGPGPLESAKNSYKRGKLQFSEKFHESYMHQFNKTGSIALITEDLPELHNRITLDSRLADRFGIPAPKIEYKLGTNSKKILSHSLNAGKQILTVAGGKEVIAYGPVKNSGWHIMGTARMGSTEETSVVNQNGQVHNIENLYILDSSIFTTSSAVNPASTIQALSLMISNGIAKKYASTDGFKFSE
jgi:choline dehydrogenase-like flavoprotein